MSDIQEKFTLMVLDFDVYGNIDRKLNGGKIANYTKKNLAFDCPAFQHHFKDIKSPYATSVQAGKDQDNQAWGGTCCNYGKVGWTYIWQKPGGYCTFSTYITDKELIYDEIGLEDDEDEFNTPALDQFSSIPESQDDSLAIQKIMSLLSNLVSQASQQKEQLSDNFLDSLLNFSQ